MADKKQIKATEGISVDGLADNFENLLNLTSDMIPPKSYMACVDGSKQSLYTVSEAMRWIDSEQTIVFAHAVGRQDVWSTGFLDKAIGDKASEKEKKQYAEGNAIRKKCLEICGKHKKNRILFAVIQSRKKSLKEAICQFAKQCQISCVFIGCRGLGAISRAFLGSTSNYVIEHAECNVMLCKKEPCAECAKSDEQHIEECPECSESQRLVEGECPDCREKQPAEKGDAEEFPKLR